MQLFLKKSVLFPRIGRVFLIVLRLFAGDISTGGPISLKLLYTLPIFMRNLLAHTMVIERTAATLLVRTYEHNRRPNFNISWFLIVV